MHSGVHLYQSMERVQKIIAKAGIASRRAAEELIRDGLVTINGAVAKLGDQADSSADAIKVRGKLLFKLETLSYFIIHKPRGVISDLSNPTPTKPTLKSFLKNFKKRVFPIGKLEINSEGLVLFTNDGKLAQEILKSKEILQSFHIKIKGHPTEKEIEKVLRGGRVDGKEIRPLQVRTVQTLQNKTKVELVMKGVDSIHFRKFFENKGFLVESVKRVSIGHLNLKGLQPGHRLILDQSQAEALVYQPELARRLLKLENKDSN